MQKINKFSPTKRLEPKWLPVRSLFCWASVTTSKHQFWFLTHLWCPSFGNSSFSHLDSVFCWHLVSISTGTFLELFFSIYNYSWRSCAHSSNPRNVCLVASSLCFAMFTSQTQTEGNHSQYSLQTPTGVLQKCTCLWRIKIGAIGKSLITILYP